MKIVFVRHGESEANVARCINDDPERAVNLTERGRKQAELAFPAETAFDFAYASEFPRARQTAEIILRETGLPIQIDPRINERRTGMDGRPVDEFNELIRNDPAGFRPARGESFLEQMERVRNFLDETSVLHAGKKILAVSHENPILAALALSGMDPSEAALGSIANCGKVEISWPIPGDPREGRSSA